MELPSRIRVLISIAALLAVLPGPPVSAGPSANSVEPAAIGGTWITPAKHFRLAGRKLHFAAHAHADAGVNHVNFTAKWQGHGWFIACATSSPTHDDVYECDWDTHNNGVPNGGSGPVTASFDVYDNASGHVLAPHGLRIEALPWDPPMNGWTVIGYQPLVGDHKGRDYWAVDLSSSDRAVFPVLPGKVVFAGWNCQTVSGHPPCYGNVVVIDHQNGLYSIYAHLRGEGLVANGADVGVNDRIGRMGHSGCDGCGDHLHFAARLGASGLGAGALFQADTPVRTPFQH
jgi:murein DD-endopeptidase MepM/ murein hydrolase activator NlpD